MKTKKLLKIEGKFGKISEIKALALFQDKSTDYYVFLKTTQLLVRTYS